MPEQDLQISKMNEALNLTSPMLIAAGLSDRVNSIRDLITASENTVALEILCDNLYDLGNPLSQEIYDLLLDTCRSNNVNERYTKPLETLLL